MSTFRAKSSTMSALPRISYAVSSQKGKQKTPFVQPAGQKKFVAESIPKQPDHSHDTLFGSCNLCDWKGCKSFVNGELADVERCSCQADSCTKCLGIGGFEVELPSGNRAWKKCDCQELERRMELFRRAQIPSRFAHKTLEAFAPNDHSQVQARTLVYKMFQNTPSNPAFKPGDPGLLITGPPGVGKTHLMVGLLRNLILERGIACRFQDFGNLLSDLRDAYSRDISEMKVLNPLIRVDVLLLDDLAKGRNSKWELGVIDMLISCRYNAGRTTFLTTNYTDQPETTLRERFRGRGNTEGEELMLRDTLIERVGDRIYSRLREMCQFFYLIGPDHRIKMHGKG